MSEKIVDELTKKHTRKELNKVTEALGLSSKDCPTKESTAEAILKASEEQRETKKLEKAPERKTTRGAREARKLEMETKMSANTVKGKVAAFRATARNMRSAAGKMISEGIAEMQENVGQFQGAIKKQMNENKEAAVLLQSGVKELQSSIKEQAKKNQKAAATFHKGVEEIQAGIMKMCEGVKDQLKETQKYITSFYG